MNEYSMMTQELQDLAALSMEHGQIPSGLYDQYHVLRGLRDVNGKGVLAGLTDISTITSSKEVDGKMVPCDGELRYRGYDIHDLVDGFVAEQRFGYEEVAYLLIFDVCYRSRNYRNSRIFLEVIVHCRRTLCETLL